MGRWKAHRKRLERMHEDYSSSFRRWPVQLGGAISGFGRKICTSGLGRKSPPRHLTIKVCFSTLLTYKHNF